MAGTAPILAQIEAAAASSPANAGATQETASGQLIHPASTSPSQVAPPSQSNGSSPAATPSNTVSNTTTGGGGGSTSDAAAVAAAQKAAQITAAINYGTSNAIAAGSAETTEQGADLGNTGQQYLVNQQTGQNNINLAREQIGETQINSIKQLQQTIKDGLQGVGVQLGDNNALGSSASDEAARAYATYGNVQTNAANNTAATGNIAQDTAQNNLNIQTSADLDMLNNSRDAAIAQIQGNAISALNNLGTLVSVYLGGDPSQINAGAIQSQIVQQAQNELGQVDQNYQNLINGINPMSSSQVATGAETMANAGVVPASGAPFNPANPTPSSTATTEFGGAPAPSLIPLTVNQPNSNDQDQIPGA